MRNPPGLDDHDSDWGKLQDNRTPHLNALSVKVPLEPVLRLGRLSGSSPDAVMQLSVTPLLPLLETWTPWTR